jgi:hypothetical protein
VSDRIGARNDATNIAIVKSASFILLQGVPSHVSLDQVRREIREVPNVTSVHEFHIWQLSESKIVASVHVCVTPGVDFMTVASRIRRILHNHGVHSSTIQPEYLVGEGPSGAHSSVCDFFPPIMHMKLTFIRDSARRGVYCDVLLTRNALQTPAAHRVVQMTPTRTTDLLS